MIRRRQPARDPAGHLVHHHLRSAGPGAGRSTGAPAAAEIPSCDKLPGVPAPVVPFPDAPRWWRSPPTDRQIRTRAAGPEARGPVAISPTRISTPLPPPGATPSSSRRPEIIPPRCRLPTRDRTPLPLPTDEPWTRITMSQVTGSHTAARSNARHAARRTPAFRWGPDSPTCESPGPRHWPEASSNPEFAARELPKLRPFPGGKNDVESLPDDCPGIELIAASEDLIQSRQLDNGLPAPPVDVLPSPSAPLSAGDWPPSGPPRYRSAANRSEPHLRPGYQFPARRGAFPAFFDAAAWQ